MVFPLNRKISAYVTPWLASWGLHPNQVTLLALGAGAFSALNFLQANPRLWLLGALWLQAAYILDNCDGELARSSGRVSGWGSWLDLITDCLIHIAFFFSLGLGLSRISSNGLWLKLGGIASVGVLLTYLTFVADQVRQRGRSAWAHPDPPEGLRDSLGRFKEALRGDFSLVVLGSALWGKMAWLLWGGVLGSFLYWVPTGLKLLTRRKR